MRKLTRRPLEPMDRISLLKQCEPVMSASQWMDYAGDLIRALHSVFQEAKEGSMLVEDLSLATATLKRGLALNWDRFQGCLEGLLEAALGTVQLLDVAHRLLKDSKWAVEFLAVFAQRYRVVVDAWNGQDRKEWVLTVALTLQLGGDLV